MTFFSRCETLQRHEPGAPGHAVWRMRVSGGTSPFLSAVAGFAEDLAILFRYAAGLDYYGRDNHIRGR